MKPEQETKMNDITIHSFADVDRSGKVRWTACELGYDIEENYLELGQHRSEDYLAINPYAQIPTAVTGGESFIESTAICIVLAERHPEQGLIPGGKAERERFWQLLHVTGSTLEAPVVNYYLAIAGILPEAWKDLLKDGLELRLNALVKELPQQGFLCGEFSLADICAAYVLRIGIQTGLLLNEGNLADYLGRLMARPAAIESRIFDSLES
jgi:glutathione S-transferase